MASVIDAFMQSLAWKLTSLDDGTEIEGQYAPSNLRHTVGANYSQMATLGRSQPILQWDGDVLETMTFDAKVFAKHQGLLGLGINADEIEDLVDAIKDTVRTGDKGRPHVFVFTAGEYFEFQCVVKSVGGIVYDRMRPSDGSLRGVMFRMELWRYDEYDTSLSGEGAESLVLPFQGNESFESFGVRVYGDPATGEALRRRNPALVVPSAGDLLHLPPKNKLMRRFSTLPQTDALRYGSNEDSKSVLLDALSRHKSYRSHTLGDAWDGK